MTDKLVPMVALRTGYLAQQNEIDAAVKRVLESGWYIMGKECETFEQDFARWCGTRHAIGVGNGTDAIVIALKSLGIGPGDAVFTVSHTAVATVAAIEMAGAIPVLVDIDPASFTIDPGKLEDAIRTHTASGRPGRPRAIIAVHLYGHPCNMEALVDICRQHQLKLLEDCAQAHGALWDGKRVGTFGDIASFSFYPTKNLGAFGDGGAVVTNTESLAQLASACRQYGWRERYLSDLAGMNSRLDEIQAAMLAVRLSRLDQEIATRRRIAGYYDDALADKVKTPTVRDRGTHAYHLYVIRTDRREALAAKLKAAGIGTGIHYPVPIHLQKAYQGRLALAPSGLAETECAAREVLSLPMHPFLSQADIERVVREVIRAI
jgi:dTDP-4-amino-4,6-dideoxygalactose transaminase